MEQDQDWLLRYADASKVAKSSLKLIWADMNVSEGSQQSRIDRIHSQALEAWPAAVKEAEKEREAMRAQVAQTREEIRKLGWELGAASEQDLDVEARPSLLCSKCGLSPLLHAKSCTCSSI